MRKGPSTCAAALVTGLLSGAAVADRAVPATAPGETDGVRIAGVVVDETGKPLAGALVRSQTGAMGRLMWWAFQPDTRTDNGGRFELRLPFAGIRYSLAAQLMGYRNTSTSFVPEADRHVRLTLRPQGATRTIRGTVARGDGQAVAGVTVKLIGEYGRRAAATTDEAGRFALRRVPGYIGQGVPLVRADGLVVPLRIVRSRGKDIRLVLAKPGRLKGVVREKATGRAVEGATVILRPWFASDLRLEASTGEDGTFDLEGIPPGKYKVTAVAGEHFVRPPRGMDAELPKVELAPGDVKRRVIEMQRCATVRGRAVDREGRPVSGALVGMRSTWLGDYRNQNRYVRTDKQGRFAINTGHLESKLPLVAYSARHGLAQVQLAELGEGQTHSAVELILPGAARVRGIVTDSNGRGLKDVNCSIEYPCTVWVKTGPDGRFDLGRLPCAPGARPRPSAAFRAPRPHRGDAYGFVYSFGGDQVPIKSLDTAPQFHLHRRVELDLRPDREVKLDVKLEPTQLLEVTGRVVGPRDQPIRDAVVSLLTGDATKEAWVRQTSNFGTSSSIDIEMTVTTLAAVRSDRDGRWRIWTVRENGVAAPMGSSRTDWTKYCIGVRTPGGNRRLVSGITVPKDDPRREVNVSFALAGPDALAALLRVRDPSDEHRRKRALTAYGELAGRQFSSADEAMEWWWQQPLAPARPEPRRLTPERREAIWRTLAQEVSSSVYADALALAGAPDGAQFVGKRLQPVPKKANHIQELIRALDHRRFATRQEAYAELCRIGRPARAALQEALGAERSSEELKARASELIAGCDRPYPSLPEARRAIRAVRILELIGTDEARQTLQALSNGMPGAMLTRRAKAAIQRLRREPGQPKPR